MVTAGKCHLFPTFFSVLFSVLIRTVHTVDLTGTVSEIDLLALEFLANVNSRSSSLYAIARPSVPSIGGRAALRLVRAVPNAGPLQLHTYNQLTTPTIAGPQNWGPGCCSTPSTLLNAALVGGFKRRRGSQIVIFDISKAISSKRCKIGIKLVLITDQIRSRIMSFRLVPKLVTLNGEMAPILHYFKA